jgi:hypothetical protein
MMPADNLSDVNKWEAFRLVKADNAEGLRQALSHHEPEAWSVWRNFAGKTLYQVAEKESLNSGSDRCLQLLREKLRQMDLVPQQVPKVDYVDRVVEHREYMDKVIEVPVQEVHYHKTLRHVPEFREVPVPEVREVERYTYKEELQVVPEIRSVPKEVIHTTIREMPEIRHVVEKREEKTDVPLPLSLTPVDRVAEVHTVDVHPRVQWVTGERKIEPHEYEQVAVPYELYVPKTEVNFIDRVVMRPKEVVVPNIKEHAVKVPVYQERDIAVTQTDTEITQHIKYVAEFPTRTEWVPKRSGGDLFDRIDTNHDGVISRAEFDAAVVGAPSVVERNIADLKYEMWYELHMLRSKSAHLGKRNAYLKKELDHYRARKQKLGDDLASERQLRQQEERQLQERKRKPVVMHLKPLPVRTDKNADAEGFGSPSTMYQSRNHDLSGSFSIDSPQFFAGAANRLFDQLDRNHDGVIDRAEWRAAMGRRS